MALSVAAPAWAEGPRSAQNNSPRRNHKLDGELNNRSTKLLGDTEVIVEFTNDKDALKILRKYGQVGKRLRSLNGYTARIPNRLLNELTKNGVVKKVSHDRPVRVLNGRTAITTGARAVQELMGYDGAGVGVAVVDSGVTSFHTDLTNVGVQNTYVPGPINPFTGLPGLGTWVATPYYYGQRVSHFADFVNGTTISYDDYGHGTHVAGIIAGNGAASDGWRKSIAPGSSIIALKALDATGAGTISNIIAAIDYAISIKSVYNIRVLNLSLGAGVYESYLSDPLTLACKRAVDAGIVVVAAAGNLGRAADGSPQYGAIVAPGNAPWVLTVGASSTEGTTDRVDDVMGLYSSRGPTSIDYRAKPDLIAPGTGTVSLSDPLSYFYLNKPHLLLAGSSGAFEYLSLTGTSMAAPVVSGTVALMLQANPNLTPNLVKAILQYTAQVYPGYNWLTQGAGFLNSHAAVELAQFFQAGTPGLPYPDMTGWSQHVFWGNRRITGGVITPAGTAWGADVAWGGTSTPSGQPIVWGENCVDNSCSNIVWGNNVVWGDECEGETCNIDWGNTDDDNIVWGNCEGENCDNIVWGNCEGEECNNIVWGNSDDDNIVWGNDCEGEDCDNIVWGNCTDENGDGECDDNIVWGNCVDENGDGECDDNIVWGNCADEDGDGECDNIVWGNCEGDNCDNIVWGNNCEGENCDNIVWGNALEVVFGDDTAEISTFDSSVWTSLFKQTFTTFNTFTTSTTVFTRLRGSIF